MKKTYTLDELSKDLDLSVQDIQSYIRRGELKATRRGGDYRVTEEALEDFLNDEVPARNYTCRYYAECLNQAAAANEVFSCEGCPRFKETPFNAMMTDFTPMFGKAVPPV